MQAQYVEADRATLVGLTGCVELGIGVASPEDAEAYRLLFNSWDARIRSAEGE